MQGFRRALALATMCAVLVTAAIAMATPVPVEPKVAQPSQFMPSSACGCHAGLAEQWSQSMHSKALTDKVFLTKVAEGDKATNGALGPFCKTCHAPAAAMMGEFAPGGKVSATGGEGVSCMFCHQATGLKPGEPGNTSQMVEADGTRRAQIKDPAAPHPATYSEFHTKAEICGGCHNVNHPVNGMHLESTYREWEKSPWAGEGVVCQDCHMSDAAGKIGPSSGQAAGGAPTRDNIYRMNFVGGNVGQGPAEEAAARLKSAADMNVEMPQIVAPGTVATVTVSITNKGAGHKLPTGLTEVREMWLEVYATGPDGAKTKVGEHIFGTILEDAKGKSPVELWDATKIKSDDRIAPRETFTETYSFTMPAGAERGDLVAVLNYRSMPEELATKAGVENPVTEMAKVTTAVFGSEAARNAAVSADKPTGGAGGSDSWNLAVIIAGLVAVFGIGIFFWLRSRKIGA